MQGMKKLVLLVAVGSLAVLSGCAGSVPSADFKKAIPDNSRLCANDDATVKLVASDGVLLNDISRQRLESRLLQTINEKKKAVKCADTAKRSFVVNTKITRYDEGNAFARFMLAGLGAMHIDGDFVLSVPSTKESVAEFSLAKTFAWGGAYGASTRIEDIEPAFSEGVAEAIIAQADNQ